jgi:hypothetical protein
MHRIASKIQNGYFFTGEVVFGQIYGMADQISVPLAAAGLL